MTDQLGDLLRFLQRNGFKLVILEGPRGAGKTTCCERLLASSDLLYYKTWGSEQKWIRDDMQRKLNLDLPQGTYFVLDFIKQAKSVLKRPILADRGNLSAIAYQRELPYGQNTELRKYYVQLMRDSEAVLLYLSAPVDVLISRRVGRKEEDEQKLHTASAGLVRRTIEHDVRLYESSLDLMVKSGLEDVDEFDLNGTTCTCFVPTDTKLVEEEDQVDEDEVT